MNKLCCASQCLTKFNSSVQWACQICYLSVLQAASCQWLRTMMYNQPRTGRQYHVYHKVYLCLQFYTVLVMLTLDFTACLQECFHACLWYFGKQNGKFPYLQHPSYRASIHQCICSCQCLDRIIWYANPSFRICVHVIMCIYSFI